MKISDYEHMVFIFPEQLESYNNGEEVIASTERFCENDLAIFVTNDEYGKESQGGTIVTIKKDGWLKLSTVTAVWGGYCYYVKIKHGKLRKRKNLRAKETNKKAN